MEPVVVKVASVGGPRRKDKLAGAVHLVGLLIEREGLRAGRLPGDQPAQPLTCQSPS